MDKKLYVCCDCGKPISEWGIRCLSCSKLNERNPLWKGDAVQYNQLHNWIKSRFPKPEKCARCENPPLDLANKTGKYLRKLTEWEWLCRRCHMKSDGRLEKFLQTCTGLKKLYGKDNPNYKHGKYSKKKGGKK